MKNLFAKDTSKTPAKAKDRVTVQIDCESQMKQMSTLDVKIAELQAQRKVLDSEVREASQDAMMSYYEKKKTFPGTLAVQAGSMELQFITSDRYKVIDEDRAIELTEKYGEDLVDEETKFAFNTAILMKNMTAINKMIVKSKDISDDDKENLIEQTTKWTVTKGTIKNLKNENFSNFDLEELIDDIKPVFSIKSIKLTK